MTFSVGFLIIQLSACCVSSSWMKIFGMTFVYLFLLLLHKAWIICGRLLMSPQRLPLTSWCIQGDKFKALFNDAASCWCEFELLWSSPILNKIFPTKQKVPQTPLSMHRNVETNGWCIQYHIYIKNICKINNSNTKLRNGWKQYVMLYCQFMGTKCNS